MKITLQLKIISIVLLLSFIWFFLLIYTSINKYNQLLENTYAEEARAIANAFNANVRDKSDLENKSLLQANIYKHILLNPNIIEINVNLRENDKITVFFSNEQAKINTFPDPENLTAVKKNILISKIIKENNNRLLRVITPINLSGQVLGTIQIDLTLEGIDKAKKDALATIFLYYSLMIAGFIIILYFLSKTITKPIEELTITAKNIAAGNLNKRARIGGKDEVGQLAISFNKMVEGLLTAEKYNQNIISAMPTSLFVLDPNLKIKTVNQSSIDLLGYKKEELTNKQFIDIFENGKTKGNTKKNSFEEAIKNKSITDHETIYTTKTGEKIPVDLSTSITKNDQGEIVNIVVTAKDLRVYKKLEAEKLEIEKIKREETEKYAKELEDLNKTKDDFLNVTAHELRTPLFPIKSQTELLLNGEFGKISKEQKESLQMIERNGKRLHRLIVDVLDISKIKSEKLRIIPEKINLEKIIRETVADLKEEAQEKKIELEIKEPITLPEINADPGRISQILGNLINNSIKFTEENGKITIMAEKIDKNKNVTVKISDNGIGLSQESIKKLFIPFAQIETGLIRKQKGTGLGLAISKGIIKAHGGDIWVESKGEGKGSTFIFTLPLENNKKEVDISI